MNPAGLYFLATSTAGAQPASRQPVEASPDQPQSSRPALRLRLAVTTIGGLLLVLAGAGLLG